MAKVQKSVKNTSKTKETKDINLEKKMKDKSKQAKSSTDVKISSKKRQLSSAEPKDAGSSLQYAVDASKPGEKSSSLKIYFPQQFSILKNMEFLDHISDAENIIFDNSVYAICKDVSIAEKICKSAKGLCIQHGANSIRRAERLGPAYCAFKRKESDPTVLTIKKLPPGLSYHDLQVRFPGAVDICLKKTMAKLKFANIDSCKQAWLCASDLLWPGGVVPSVGNFPQEIEGEELMEKPDPDHLMFGHPSKFVEDPCVIFLFLKNRFELTKETDVLDVLKTATDIILSRSCTVVFSNSKDAWKRRQLLAGHSVIGGDVVAWISRRQNDDNSTSSKSFKPSEKTMTKPEVESAEEDEAILPPPAKKMKKKITE